MTSLPSGYMVPLPRVGRHSSNQAKRQNMIPQPRIGRELDINDEMAEILFEIQSLMGNDELIPGHLVNKMKENLSSVVKKNLFNSEIQNIATENPVFLERESTFSSNKNHVSSHLFQEESTKPRDESNVDNIRISYLPNGEGSNLASKPMKSGPKLLKNPKCFTCVATSAVGNDA